MRIGKSPVAWRFFKPRRMASMCGSSSELTFISMSVTLRALFIVYTYNRKDNVCLGRQIFEKLEVLDSTNCGLHTECLELFGLFFRTN